MFVLVVKLIDRVSIL